MTARYYEGLTPEEAEARRLQFSIQALLSSDDPTAYRKAPGDDREGIRKSRYTLQYQGLYGVERESNPRDSADPPSWLVALENKAQETGAPLWALIAVYRRGLAAWRTGHRPGANAFAWGMARVNSFLVGGKTFHGPDRDIATAARWTPRTPNPTHTIYSFLSLGEIARWIPLMRDLGVSEVARSERGFLTAYQNAQTPGGLPEEWAQKRNAYIARRLGQMDAQATPLFFERGTHRGLPTRAHLSLIAWAYSPDPSGLAAIRSRAF